MHSNGYLSEEILNENIMSLVKICFYKVRNNNTVFQFFYTNADICILFLLIIIALKLLCFKELKTKYFFKIHWFLLFNDKKIEKISAKCIVNLFE